MANETNIGGVEISGIEGSQIQIGDITVDVKAGDRFKDMIIKGGYNIYPSEIEGYLEEHPAVSEIAIIGVPDAKYGEEIMAFVVPMPEQELSEDAVIEFAKSRMTPFKAPSRVKFLDGLPKSLVGKVLKKELRKML
jgi:acyl-CoA synthetase (AMP-forming)/AMP-acid ligase II